jgi:hypothetical protein
MNGELPRSGQPEPAAAEYLQRLEREARHVKRYAGGVALLVGALSLVAFQQAGRTRFTEIDVERLNIIEKNGRLRLAIANPDRIPPITIYGKEYPGLRGGSAPGAAGMIYFNEEGTEVGGWLWRGRTLPDGSHSAAGFLTFDQYNQDETIALSYIDNNGRRTAGLSIYDEPNAPIQPVLDSIMAIRAMPEGAEKTRRMERFREWQRQLPERRATRFFAGKDATKSSVVSLLDPKGRPRLKLSVDSLGTPRVEFLDADGKVSTRVTADPSGR